LPVRGSLCQFYGQFLEPTPAKSLLCIGDESLRYAFEFVDDYELVDLRNVCTDFEKLAVRKLLRNLSVSIRKEEDDEEEKCLFSCGEHGVLSTEVKMDESIPTINYHLVDRLELHLCCDEHTEHVVRPAYEAAFVKDVSFRMSGQDCADPECELTAIRQYLKYLGERVECVNLTLKAEELDELYILDGFLAPLKNLQKLEINIGGWFPDDIDYEALLSGVSSSIKHFSVSFTAGANVAGLVSFPWASCTSISLTNVRLFIEDFRLMLQKLDRCDVLTLDNLELRHHQTMDLFEFVDFPVCSHLKTLGLLSSCNWIAESLDEWHTKSRFPVLESLRVNGFISFCCQCILCFSSNSLLKNTMCD
jgi:hypothetical protein